MTDCVVCADRVVLFCLWYVVAYFLKKIQKYLRVCLRTSSIFFSGWSRFYSVESRVQCMFSVSVCSSLFNFVRMYENVSDLFTKPF